MGLSVKGKALEPRLRVGAVGYAYAPLRADTAGCDVSSLYYNSAAFNGQTATASRQTRVGTISKASGTFAVDHPLDPLNRILNHYFVESPQIVLIYRGMADRTRGPCGSASSQLFRRPEPAPHGAVDRDRNA